MHRMFKHGCIRHRLIEVGSDSVCSMASNDNAAHTALLQRFSNLAKEFFLRIIVRIYDDNFANLFFPENIDWLDEDLLKELRGFL